MAERANQSHPSAHKPEYPQTAGPALRWPCHIATVTSSVPICADEPGNLLNRGIEIHEYRDGAQALLGIGSLQPEFVIAPTDMTGIDLCAFVNAIVELTGIPVLVGVLPGEDSHTTGFHALERGARGFIPLPATAERIASSIAPLGYVRNDAATELVNGNLHLNPQSLRASVSGTTVHLAPKEFEVLKYLMLQAPRVVSVEEITAHGKDHTNGAITRTRLAIMRTRKKLTEASPTGESFIETVRGVGYRMAL